MRLSADGEEPSPAIPKVGIIAPPSDYTSVSGEKISAGDYDISARMVSMFDLHPAIGITSAIALARVSFVEGSLVHDAIDKRVLQNIDAENEVAIRIGTPVGIIVCRVQLSESGKVARLGVRRVARRIAHADIDLPLVS